MRAGIVVIFILAGGLGRSMTGKKKEKEKKKT